MKAEFAEFSFSTSWNWRGSDSGTRVVEEILALGFDSVELNYKSTTCFPSLMTRVSTPIHGCWATATWNCGGRPSN